MPDHTSLESAKTMLCAMTALTSQFAHQTCLYNFNMSMTFLTEGSMHNNGTKKPLCSVAGDIDADPSAPNHQYSEYAKPVLVLIYR